MSTEITKFPLNVFTRQHGECYEYRATVEGKSLVGAKRCRILGFPFISATVYAQAEMTAHGRMGVAPAIAEVFGAHVEGRLTRNAGELYFNPSDEWVPFIKSHAK